MVRYGVVRGGRRDTRRTGGAAVVYARAKPRAARRFAKPPELSVFGRRPESRYTDTVTPFQVVTVSYTVSGCSVAPAFRQHAKPKPTAAAAPELQPQPQPPKISTFQHPSVVVSSPIQADTLHESFRPPLSTRISLVETGEIAFASESSSPASVR